MTRDAGHTEVVEIYRSMGCKVFDHSHPGREPRTTQPGHPDLTVFRPSRKMMWYHEVKTVEGALTRAQERFRMVAAECGIETVVGGPKEAVEKLGGKYVPEA